MLAKIAKEDLSRLRAAGYRPTDDEVVRLNDLGLRIERGKEMTVANMPRVAMAGNVALYEPTFAALEWWHNFGRDAAWTTHGKIEIYYYCLANARRPEAFENLTDPAAIRKAVRIWKRGVFATDGELWRALLWVRHADVDLGGSEADDRVDDSVATEDELDRLFRTIIAASGALGVTPSDLRCETMTTLVALLLEKNVREKLPVKPSVAKDYIAYQAVVRQIEARGKDPV